MTHYPDRHHPCFMLEDALRALGADALVVRDATTCGCWGLHVNGRIVVWLIDNRWPHEREKEDPAAAELLKRGALVMCAQKPDAERVGGKWLPLAVTPGYRPPDKSVEKLHDVGFVGWVRDMGRMITLASIARHFSLDVVQGVFEDAAIDVYWRSKVVINVPTQYGNPLAYDSANMRLFEALATGTPVVTSYEPYLESLGLDDGNTCMTYKSPDEAVAKIGQLVQDTVLAKRIGDCGESVARQWHTYGHRAKTVLEWLK